MTITRQIIFLAKRDCIEELKDLLKSVHPNIKNFDGCLKLDIYQTKNNLVEFIFIESWENAHLLSLYFKSKTYLDFKEKLNQYIAHIEPFELEPL
jgi:quinol monooxygenase YgiN